MGILDSIRDFLHDRHSARGQEKWHQMTDGERATINENGGPWPWHTKRETAAIEASREANLEAKDTPALTPEGTEEGFSWDTSNHANFSADLWHKGQMMAGVFAPSDPHLGAWVDVSADSYAANPDGEMKNLGGMYPTLEEGMKAAEQHALHEIGAIDVQPWIDISESYYAKLAALAENRGADMERGNDFDMER